MIRTREAPPKMSVEYHAWGAPATHDLISGRVGDWGSQYYAVTNQGNTTGLAAVVPSPLGEKCYVRIDPKSGLMTIYFRRELITGSPQEVADFLRAAVVKDTWRNHVFERSPKCVGFAPTPETTATWEQEGRERHAAYLLLVEERCKLIEAWHPN